MSTNLIKKSVVKNANDDLLMVVLPNAFAVVKTLNSMSRKGSKHYSAAVATLFEKCGLRPGTLTFEFFDEYLYEVVEFVLSDADCKKLSGSVVTDVMNNGLTRFLGRGDGSANVFGLSSAVVRPSVSADLKTAVIRLKDTAVCLSSRLVFVHPDGRLSDVAPCFGDDAITCDCVRIGTNVLPNSPFVWCELMRVIGNKNIKRNNAALRLQKLNAKAIEKAKKEYAKRVGSLGGDISEMPQAILDKIYNNCLVWAKNKVGLKVV